MHFPDVDGLAGEDRAEIDFFLAQTHATAAGDHDGFVVEWIVDVGQSLVNLSNRACCCKKFPLAGLVDTFNADAQTQSPDRQFAQIK